MSRAKWWSAVGIALLSFGAHAFLSRLWGLPGGSVWIAISLTCFSLTLLTRAHGYFFPAWTALGIGGYQLVAAYWFAEYTAAPIYVQLIFAAIVLLGIYVTMQRLMGTWPLWIGLIACTGGLLVWLKDFTEGNMAFLYPAALALIGAGFLIYAAVRVTRARKPGFAVAGAGRATGSQTQSAAVPPPAHLPEMPPAAPAPQFTLRITRESERPAPMGPAATAAVSVTPATVSRDFNPDDFRPKHAGQAAEVEERGEPETWPLSHLTEQEET